MTSAPDIRPTSPHVKPKLTLVPKTGRPIGERDLDLPIGARHHRAFVGAADGYDISAAMQFNLLTFLGLRQHHYFLDIGCGSLRGGRLFIPYLQPGRYYGIEPEEWLIEEGIKNEIGRDLIDIKQPAFKSDHDFRLTAFSQRFDFILAQSIFSHASLTQIQTCLCEAKQVMEPTAFFAATFVRGEQDYEGDAWVYPGCVSYSLDTMVRVAREQGLACQPLHWPHPFQQTWVMFAHPEHAEQIPDLGDMTRVLCLENDLRFAKARLAKLEGHPYVRLGMKVVGHPLYSKLRQTTNRLRKAA